MRLLPVFAFGCSLLLSIPLWALEPAATESVETRIDACPGMREWKSAMERHAAALPKRKAPTLADIRQQLLAMAETDQKVRAPSVNGSGQPLSAAELKTMFDTDARNLARFKTIFRRMGFPPASAVGVDGSNAAFLLVQHASDLSFQKLVLLSLESRVRAGEASPSDYALLLDRTLIQEGKPQRYGSQFSTLEGVSVLDPVENPAQLDARRAEVLLPPMAAYACVIETAYGQKIDLSAAQIQR